MEQCLDDNMYMVDLGEVNSAAEVIFELSNILDNDEVKNKRIHLRLGDVTLNQAQLLSIKSLINGVDSTLSTIDTKSSDTEKVALSLGIIVSNESEENNTEIKPQTTYTPQEEYKEEQNSEEAYKIVEESDISVTEEQEPVEEQEIIQENVSSQTSQEIVEDTLQEEVKEEISPEATIEQPQNSEQKNDVKDELEVIFGSTPVQTSIFDTELPKEVYETKNELEDIVVPEEEYTKEDLEIESFPTKYIKQTIRSGQVISYEGNIIIIGDCHPGCEIKAFGDITVWGILGGIAHAGAAGNQKARVRALKMNAIQLRIADCYSRRPDSLNTVYVEKTNSFTPEEARIINNEIVVFKIND